MCVCYILVFIGSSWFIVGSEMVTANAANAQNAYRGVSLSGRSAGLDTVSAPALKCLPKFWEYDLAYRPGIASNERRQSWTTSESCCKSQCVREAIWGLDAKSGVLPAECRSQEVAGCCGGIPSDRSGRPTRAKLDRCEAGSVRSWIRAREATKSRTVGATQ